MRKKATSQLKNLEEKGKQPLAFYVVCAIALLRQTCCGHAQPQCSYVLLSAFCNLIF